MRTQANNQSKVNSFKISEQVKSILQKKGLSKVFNYQDYTWFKEKAKDAFNIPQSIANMFIEENTNNSDFLDYNF